jgi:tripartite-type tricarboxylate transporter receptor subunit TctC
LFPTAPAAGTDAVGRLAAKALEEMWGQTVIVDNRTGGNGSVGAALVARATPDGHTLVLAVSGIAINAHLMKLPYDTATAFAPVTAIAYPVATLLATPRPARPTTSRELQALVKKEGPEKRTSASPDPGSRLMAERIFDSAGIKLLNVPYKGAASFVGDILCRPRRCWYRQRPPSGLALINAGKLKVASVSMGTKRIPGAAQTRRLSRSRASRGWTRIPGTACSPPAGTPPATVEAIQKDIATLLARPDFPGEAGRLRFTARGGDTPACLQRTVSSATSRSRVRRSAGSASTAD